MPQVKKRLNTRLIQAINHIFIVSQTSFSHFLGTIGKNTGSRDRKAKGFQTKLLHHLNILWIFMIKVSRTIGVSAKKLLGGELDKNAPLHLRPCRPRDNRFRFSKQNKQHQIKSLLEK